ncbi:MAG: SDR family oxidoreductase [Bdellovibrionales bacterium]|nr:SDR family oxidoreductase [Bdellovibrionales bacterium]
MSTVQHKVVVTGASQGIGAAIAEVYAKKGAELFLVARNEAKLKEVADRCLQAGASRVEVFAVDLSNPESWASVVNQAETRKFQADTLVNNAGYGVWGEFEKLSLEEQLKNMRLNMDCVVSLTHLFLPMLRKHQKSYVLNVASTTAYQAMPTFAVYAASKSFVLSFTRAIHHELKKSGVVISCLVPGATSTGFISRAGLEHAAEKAEKVSMEPMAVAKIGVEGLLKAKLEIVPGFVNVLSKGLVPLLPKGLVESAAASIYEKK